MINEKNTIVFPIAMTEEEDKDLSGCAAQGHLLDVLRYFRSSIGKDNEQVATLLDVGCRDDTTQPFFVKRGFNWIGIDLHPTIHAVLKGDMHVLPIGDGSIDFLFCSHAVEHSERPIDVLKEFKRVTKLAGYIFLATPAYSHYQLFGCDKEHVNVPTMQQMRRWAEHTGLKIIHQTYVKSELYEDRLASLITILQVVNK